MPQETQGQPSTVQGQQPVVQGDKPTPQQTNATPQVNDATPKPQGKLFTEAEVQEQVKKAQQSSNEAAKEWRNKANQADALQRQLDVMKLELETPYPTEDGRKFAEQLRALKLDIAKKEAEIAQMNSELGSFREKDAEAQRLNKAQLLAAKHNVDVSDLLAFKTDSEMYEAIAEGKVTPKTTEKLPPVNPSIPSSAITPKTPDDLIREGLKQKRK